MNAKFKCFNGFLKKLASLSFYYNLIDIQEKIVILRCDK